MSETIVLPPGFARTWAGLTTEEALIWRDHGFAGEPGPARRWRDAGVSPQVAQEWRKAHGDNGLPTVGNWVAAGQDPTKFSEWVLARYRYEDAQPWIEMDATLETVVTLTCRGISAKQAKPWLDEDFSAEDILECIESP